MEISMTEIGLMIRLMDMEFFKILMVLSMRGIGWKINSMVMEKRLGKMEKLGTLETSIRARNTARESLSGMMDPIMMESFRMDILRAMVSVQ
jgi:hypothetical protein